MPLDKAKLLDNLKNLPPANDPATAAANFGKAFMDYYSGATIIDATPILTPLDPLFLTTLGSQTFIQTLGTILQTWFLTVSWTASTATALPGTTMAIGPALDILLAAFIVNSLADKSDPLKDTLPEFVDIIDSWSKTIVVTLLNNVTAAPIVVVMT